MILRRGGEEKKRTGAQRAHQLEVAHAQVLGRAAQLLVSRILLDLLGRQHLLLVAELGDELLLLQGGVGLRERGGWRC